MDKEPSASMTGPFITTITVAERVSLHMEGCASNVIRDLRRLVTAITLLFVQQSWLLQESSKGDCGCIVRLIRRVSERRESTYEHMKNVLAETRRSVLSLHFLLYLDVSYECVVDASQPPKSSRV